MEKWTSSLWTVGTNDDDKIGGKMQNSFTSLVKSCIHISRFIGVTYKAQCAVLNIFVLLELGYSSSIRSSAIIDGYSWLFVVMAN